MSQFVKDPWNNSNAVPHFTPLKSAEYLTDPVVIRAYNQLCDSPDDQIRFIRRISRSLHFGIWIRSVAWFCSLVFAVGISFMMIVEMDFHMKSLIYPQTVVIEDEDSDSVSQTLSIQAESGEQVAETESPTVR